MQHGARAAGSSSAAREASANIRRAHRRSPVAQRARTDAGAHSGERMGSSRLTGSTSRVTKVKLIAAAALHKQALLLALALALPTQLRTCTAAAAQLHEIENDLAPPAPWPPAVPVASVWETALGSSARLSRLPDQPASPGEAPPVSPAHPTLVLDASSRQRRQKIVGFGGAFTEAAAVALAAASPLQQKQVLEGYFGESGLGYSLCRVHMGSCDYCQASYSEDDTPGDWNLQHFNVSHDELLLLPLIRRALATRASWSGPRVALLASPWSPPAWLKTNGKMSGKPRKKHKLAGASLLPDSDGHSPAATWALYFSKFISAYAAHGVDIEYVTAQNEPTNFPCAWESCHFTPTTQASFIAQHLGPTLNRTHPDVKILVLDDNKDLLESWTSTVYNSAAAPYVAGAGLHWYTGDHFDAVARVNAAHPTKMLLATEGCTGPGAAATDEFGWGRAESYAHDIIGDLNAGASGWIDWNLALKVSNCTAAGQPSCRSDAGAIVGPCCTTGPNHVDDVGDDAPVIVDTVLGGVRFQPSFYYIGHFSRFLLAGSTRIGATLRQSEMDRRQRCASGAFGGENRDCIEVVAFAPKADNSATVAIVLNRGSQALSVAIQFKSSHGEVWTLKVPLAPRSIKTVSLKHGDN